MVKTQPPIWRELTATGLNFLRTELKTAGTFARIAAGAGPHTPRSVRNRAYARLAYDTVKELRGRLRLNNSDLRSINREMGRLKSELEKLGEKF